MNPRAFVNAFHVIEIIPQEKSSGDTEEQQVVSRALYDDVCP
jgi:hypothetical protein